VERTAVLPEAELFVEAERVLVEVLGRIRPEDAELRLPPVRTGDPEQSLQQAVRRFVDDDRSLAAALGRPGPVDTVVGASAQACAAAAAADGDADLLLQAAVARSLLAHYVATAALGSTACPLPEELARPLWERTAPEAAAWRERGWFRAPLPLPPHVSERDRFLRTAGHDPHPAH
jgi:nucleotide-binding universal stress UspA family protein